MNQKALQRLQGLRAENDTAREAMQELRPRFDRLAGRLENGTAPRAVAAFNLFPTPEPLARRMAELLNLQPGMRVLEPSAGLGRLVTAARAFDPGEIVMVDKSPDCAAELGLMFPGSLIHCDDFLNCDPFDFGLFDAVIMNPPFRNGLDIEHILHAAQFVKSGGRLVALCMDTHHREKLLRPLADTWEKIPAGTFRKTGTGVATVLLTANL